MHRLPAEATSSGPQDEGIVPCVKAYHDGVLKRGVDLCSDEAGTGPVYNAALQWLLFQLKNDLQPRLRRVLELGLPGDYTNICGSVEIEPYEGQTLDAKHPGTTPAIYPGHSPAIDAEDGGKMGHVPTASTCLSCLVQNSAVHPSSRHLSMVRCRRV